MRRWSVMLALLGLALFTPLWAYAATDSDGDGVSDEDELTVYFTDPHNPDTDGDGFPDGLELKNGYSPHKGGGVRFADHDLDGDGLSDALERAFGTSLQNPDTDGDAVSDGDEVARGTSPTSKDNKPLPKSIEVRLGAQELSYRLAGVTLGTFSVSSGKATTPTPKGTFTIENKSPRAWSRTAQLWMPYWMAFTGNGKYGLHELPEWPGGRKEGQDHLGTPVSGGCVRLGVGDAKFLYEWAPVGTKVVIMD